MTVHWSDIGSDQRIDLIKQVYERGMSASNIAAHFHGASRNAIIGMYTRHSQKLADCPLLNPKRANGHRVRNYRSGEKRPRPRIKPVQVRLVPRPVIAGELHTVGVPLLHITDGQCKFAVNNAAKGELHLFCGAPSNGSFCENHMRIAYKPCGGNEGKNGKGTAETKAAGE